MYCKLLAWKEKGFSSGQKNEFSCCEESSLPNEMQVYIIIRKTSVTVYICVHFNLECVPYTMSVGSALTYRRLQDCSKQAA